MPSTAGLVIVGSVGATALGITALAAPFVTPALRKHALPYVPATDVQLYNIRQAWCFSTCLIVKSILINHLLICRCSNISRPAKDPLELWTSALEMAA